MAYYPDQVTDVAVDAANRFAVIRARCAKQCVQCYVNGELLAAARPYDGRVQFAIPPLDKRDVVFLLAVDAADAETDYFFDAYPGASANANRIRMYVHAESAYLPTDKAKFYRGDAGDQAAEALVSEQFLFPAGQGCGGWGRLWGRAWGVEDFGLGWGCNWGFGWGYGTPRIEFTTEPLGPGIYPVKVVVEDQAGNTSTEATDTVTLASYAEPATDLTVDSYALETDALALSWTASADV